MGTMSIDEVRNKVCEAWMAIEETYGVIPEEEKEELVMSLVKFNGQCLLHKHQVMKEILEEIEKL